MKPDPLACAAGPQRAGAPRGDPPVGDPHASAATAMERAGAAGADPLIPVIEALLGAARSAAASEVEAAGAEAAHTVAEAERDAEALLATARGQGAADAAAAALAYRARGRREARAIVLSARRRAYNELVARARLAVRSELGTPALSGTLTALARKALGPQAVVQPADGGVVASAAGRRIVLSLDGFTDRAIEELGLEL